MERAFWRQVSWCVHTLPLTPPTFIYPPPLTLSSSARGVRIGDPGAPGLPGRPGELERCSGVLPVAREEAAHRGGVGVGGARRAARYGVCRRGVRRPGRFRSDPASLAFQVGRTPGETSSRPAGATCGRSDGRGLRGGGGNGAQVVTLAEFVVGIIPRKRHRRRWIPRSLACGGVPSTEQLRSVSVNRQRHMTSGVYQIPPPPSAGLYDMMGNTWEWTSTSFPGAQPMYVLRGASWIDTADGSANHKARVTTR